MPVTAERHPITGAWLVATVHNGHFISSAYQGFTKKEAISMFKRVYLGVEKRQ
jgi:hypothetical protein